MAKEKEVKEPLTKQPIGKLEASLWKSADKLRKNIDAAEYKHVVLGLIFLKYISDAFEELYDKLKAGEDPYEDIKGFCASATKERVAELDYVLTPGRYVGLAEEEDDFDFVERFTSLKAEFEAQLKEETELNERITDNLNKIQLPND